jgi:hypothetical protein
VFFGGYHNFVFGGWGVGGGGGGAPPLLWKRVVLSSDERNNNMEPTWVDPLDSVNLCPWKY